MEAWLHTARGNNFIKQDISNAPSNIDIVQQGDTKHKQFGNKEQIKTMIDIISNPQESQLETTNSGRIR